MKIGVCFFFLMLWWLNHAGLHAQSNLIWQTSKESNLRLSPFDTVKFEPYVQPLETELCVFVDDTKTYQEIVGIGGAITDASAETFAKASKKNQAKLLELFFDAEKGLGYSLIRTNMNSCDFSSASYSYIQEGDFALSTFSIKHDEKYKIPFIQLAFSKAKELKLFVSPWSPPAFMKTNGSMLKGGSLKPEARAAWALYYARFIQAYERAGIPVWGLSIQNEPMATQRWESCIYSAEEERDFLKYFLGPTLHKEGLAKKKVIVWDHNRDLLFQRAMALFGDSLANTYAWGIGYHWYEPWSGGEPMHDNIALVNERFPSKPILFTEGCKEAFKEEGISNWSLGEFYAKQMIRDFNRGVCGWADWNILLDEKGGPNHVGNFCFSPIHLDTRSDELKPTNALYYLGHFSKFIRPGARRISCSVSRSNLLATAFKNPTGKTAIVLLNEGEKPLEYNLFFKGKRAKINLMAHSIQTLVLD